MKNILVFFFLTITCFSHSQLRFEGVVKDSSGIALELANVIAINKSTSALESYAITDEKGYFLLSLGKNETYKFQVSYIGMKSLEQEVTTIEANITQNFTLLPDNALDAVELTYEMPVTVKGDTLVYNADSFKTGADRKLEDVLENLPGVEINEDGQVEVEGKVVINSWLMVKIFLTETLKLLPKIFHQMQ